MNTPGIWKILTDGGKYPAVSIVSFLAGIDVVNKLTVIVERTSAKFPYFPNP